VADTVSNDSLNVVLSRDELLLMLNILEAEGLPGLDADPLGNMSSDQRALALAVALRGLRARGLAQQDEDGQIKVHSDLLEIVAACAYSTGAVFAYHWPIGGETPRRYFGHLRQENVVAHTRLDEVLHLFARLASLAHLVDSVLAACSFSAGAGNDLTLELTGAQFSDVRQLAADGDGEEALSTLAELGADETAARSLVETLSANPAISILQVLAQPDPESVLKLDFTLVQAGSSGWVMTPIAGDADPAQLLVRQMSRSQAAALLREALGA